MKLVLTDFFSPIFSLNADPEHNPYTPKKKVEDLQHDDRFLINA